MHASPYLINDLVLVDQLSTGNEVLLDLRFMGSRVK
jgi:hypothetical protein